MLPCVVRLIVGALLVGVSPVMLAQTEATPATDNVPCPPPVASMGPARLPAAAPFFDAAALDYVRLLPPPPAPDSVVAEAEIDVVRQVQAMRTAGDVEW